MGLFSKPRLAPKNLLPLRRGMGAISAVGEQYHLRDLKKVWKLVPDRDHITVALVPEPTNRYDSAAVRMDVLVDGFAFTAGYVPKVESAAIHRVLAPLAAAGYTGIGDGKIRIGHKHLEVYARLSEEPELLVPPPINDPNGQFIDGYFDLTVTGEEAYQEVIASNAQRRNLVFALHPSLVSKGKYAGETTYTVYLDGMVVGVLTRAMAVKHGPVFDLVFQSGSRPYLAGRIEKDHRGFQVILEGPRRFG